MKIKCIIVDDEPASREILKNYIENCSSLELIKSCTNAFEATEIINQKSVHLIFLDINMPKLSGLSFYRSLTHPPYVIFTTAYPEFAVEGFEVNAIDYLLKPFPFERFMKAVNKAVEIIDDKPKTGQETDYILLKSEKKIYKVNILEISNLEALGDYVRVDYANNSILVHERFQNLLDLLPAENFIRIHKSHALQVGMIELIEGNMVKIKEKLLPIGPTYRNGFIKFIRDKGIRTT